MSLTLESCFTLMTVDKGQPACAIKTCTLYPFTGPGSAGWPWANRRPRARSLSNWLCVLGSVSSLDQGLWVLCHPSFTWALKLHDCIVLAKGHCCFFLGCFHGQGIPGPNVNGVSWWQDALGCLAEQSLTTQQQKGAEKSYPGRDAGWALTGSWGYF